MLACLMYLTDTVGVPNVSLKVTRVYSVNNLYHGSMAMDTHGGWGVANNLH